jgi:hypothetical protein
MDDISYPVHMTFFERKTDRHGHKKGTAGTVNPSLRRLLCLYLHHVTGKETCAMLGLWGSDFHQGHSVSALWRAGTRAVLL